MAMTYSLNYGNEKSLSELFIYQMFNDTVSSPRSLHFFIERKNKIYPLIKPWQDLSSIHVIKKPIYPITTRDQLMLITAFFGFSKSKLGELLGVSRQCIYDWFNNADITIENSRKIKFLTDIAFEVASKPSQQIFHIYANDVISGYDKSLINYLLNGDTEKEKIVALARTIYEMSIERWKRIEAIPKAQYRKRDT